MFKKIPGNTKYRINLRQDVIDEEGVLVDLSVQGSDYVTLELFGKQTTISSRRLALLAWYEVGTIGQLSEIIDKIAFRAVDSKILRVECGFLMTFPEPVQYGKGFRIIPNYHHYAIDIDGRVLDTSTNSLIAKTIDSDGYVSVYIRSPDKGKNKTVRVHRLMALTWLPNDDFITRPFVNHIDGRKNNYRLENLEWCSLSENTRHALETGLTDTCVRMKSRDVRTGEVVVYSSCSEMSKKLGTTSAAASNYLNKLPGFLHRGRYEIKSLEDETPWYYEEIAHDWKEGDPVKAVYSIRIMDKTTGEVLNFSNVKSFCTKFKIRLPSINVERAAEVFRDRYPHYELTVKRNAVHGPYQIVDLTSNQIIVVNSIQHVADLTKLNRSGLQYDLCRGRKFIYDQRWLVVPGQGPVDHSQYIEKVGDARRVEMKSITGKVSNVASMKEAARLSGLDYKSVVKSVVTGSSIKGWNFRALDR